MVRMCKMKGCKVKQGQGKLLFKFPNDPVMRKLWISRTGRTQWNPKITSCVCEDHFDAAQWEKVRTDGSRLLRLGAVPSLLETKIEGAENLFPLKSHDNDCVSQYNVVQTRVSKMNKSRSYAICSVRHCQNTNKNSNCHFFRFPKNDERLRQWAIACHREDLLEKPLEKVYSSNKICSNHFEDRMYVNDLKNRLLPLAQPTLNLSENLENDLNKVICANVKTNTSSGIRQTIYSLEEEERLQLFPEHNVLAEHNYVDLESINTTANSLKFSNVGFLANNSNMTVPKIAVTARPNGVRNHRGAHLPLTMSRSNHKITQTTSDLSAYTPRTLKLQKQIRILKKEISALHKRIKKMSDETSPGRRYSLMSKRLCLNYIQKSQERIGLCHRYFICHKEELNKMTRALKRKLIATQPVILEAAERIRTFRGNEMEIHDSHMLIRTHVYENITFWLDRKWRTRIFIFIDSNSTIYCSNIAAILSYCICSAILLIHYMQRWTW